MGRPPSGLDRLLDVTASVAAFAALAFAVAGLVVYVGALVRLDFLVPYAIGLGVLGGACWLWLRREHRLEQPGQPVTDTVKVPAAR